MFDMKYISHRGNISRKNSKEQNAIPYITMALNFGYDVQIDIWWIQDKIFLGHDTPSIEVDYGFISDNKQKLWVHCKNIEALHYFITKSDIRCFFHNNDDAVLTSNGFIWTYPGKTLTEISIAVLPQMSKYDSHDLLQVYAICSDNIEYYRSYYENIRH